MTDRCQRLWRLNTILLTTSSVWRCQEKIIEIQIQVFHSKPSCVALADWLLNVKTSLWPVKPVEVDESLIEPTQLSALLLYTSSTYRVFNWSLQEDDSLPPCYLCQQITASQQPSHLSFGFKYIPLYIPLYTLVRGCEKKEECQFNLSNNVRLQALTPPWKFKSTWNKLCVFSA